MHRGVGLLLAADAISSIGVEAVGRGESHFASGRRVLHYDSMASDTPSDRDVVTTSTGWKIVGRRTARLLREHGEGEGGWSGGTRGFRPGPPEHALFGASFTLRPRAGSGQPGTQVLEALTTAIRAGWPEAPHLRRDEPVDRPATRFTGLVWDGVRDSEGWTGELLWRVPHPTARGTACTTHLILEERKRWTRLSLRVTADDGFERIRGMVGAGQARPTFLAPLRRTLRFTFRGAEVQPRTLGPLDIPDFVENRLLSPSREVPIVVLSPAEEGGYAIDPEALLDELLGVAHLFVIDEHRTTFKLSDALGDRRLSCYWGAMRGYLPGLSRDDDPLDHPLLTSDRLLDPVMRAGAIMGPFGHRAGQSLEMPPGVRARRGTEAGDEGHSARGRDAGAESTEEECGPPEVASTLSATSEEEQTAEPLSASGSPSTTTGAATDRVIELLETLDRGMRGLAHSHAELLDEVEQLRTVSSLRSARTAALERRIARLEGALERWMEVAEGRGSGEDDGDREPSVPDEALPEGHSDEDHRPSLPEVVRRAAEVHQEHLFVLDSAIDAARESPYEDPEQVAVVLDAMARVARKRGDGSLGTGLADAFRELGIDYRGGISRSTSRRLREQYLFYDSKGSEYDCVEHIAMGSSYDPRFCLRIYFTSRVPVESRFVIGHVGRHFEVQTTN